MADEICGWLVCGDPERPCVLKPGHKWSHEDESARAKGRESCREYNRRNPEKIREGQRKYYKANSKRLIEQTREYRREYYQAHPEKGQKNNAIRRSRLLAVPHVDWTKAQLIERYGAYCYICKKPLGESWHADHVIPISRGGFDRIENLRPACQPCNNRKKDKMPPAILQGKVWYELGVWHAGLVSP